MSEARYENGSRKEGKQVRLITPDDARRIREERHAGATYAELGRKWDMSPVSAWQICRGNTYKDAGGPLDSGGRRPPDPVPVSAPEAAEIARRARVQQEREIREARIQRLQERNGLPSAGGGAGVPGGPPPRGRASR